MVYLDEVYKLLPKAKNTKVMTKYSQSTRDIINQVLTQHKENVKQAKLIAHLFDTGEAYTTCQNIWNFLKFEVPYKVEPSSSQTTKTLSRIIYDAKFNTGANDCKHYSGFTGAILDALGYKFTYRFAGYSDYINVPTHVYVICKNGKNNIFVDAVISGFDVEKPYKLKIDKNIKNMSLYKLSGVEDNSTLEPQVGNLLKKTKAAAKKAGSAIKKGAKAVVKPVAAAAKAVKQGAATVGLAIPRNAFLVLIRFNVHGWATGLNKMSFEKLKFWQQIGGNRTDLMNAIKAGASKKRILGVENNDMLVGIGEPVTVAAALTTAAPIILKVQTLLSEAEKISKTAEGITSSINKTKDAVKKADSGFKALTGKSVTDIIYKKEEGKTGDKNSLSSSDFSSPTDAEASSVANSIVNPKNKPVDNKILVLGGAALVAALVFSKRK
jgi:hypothetical protein